MTQNELLKSDTLLKDYKNNGFVVLHDFFDTTEMNDVLMETENIVSNLSAYYPFVEYRSFPWGSKILERVIPVSAKSTFFEKLSMNERIIKISKKLLETQNDIYFLKDKLTFKPANQEGYEAHQDLSWWAKDGISEALTFMLVLDDNNELNGGVQFLTSSHHQLLTNPNEPRNLNSNELSGFNENNWVLPILKSGDAVFFSALIIHKSEPNLSNNWRRIYYSSYYK